MMMNPRNLDISAYASEWVQKTEKIAEMNNVAVEDDYEFAFMNYLSQLGNTKNPYVSDNLASDPRNTPKPYVSGTFLSDPTLNIPKRRRTINQKKPNKLKRSVSEINHGINDSMQGKSKRRKIAKKSKNDDDHPYLPSLPRLVIIPPKPEKDCRSSLGCRASVLPVEFRNKIEEMRGFDIQIVIQKELTPTDVDRGQACLSIPVSQISESKFLTEKEHANLKTKINGKPYGLAVPLIDPKLRYTDVILRWRGLEKANGTSNPKYVLTTGWNNLVTANRFLAGEIIQVWSFLVRADNEDDPPKLHFALVRVSDTTI